MSTTQREKLIAIKGEPIAQINFDVFSDGKLSMWSTLNHASEYPDIKGHFIKMRYHLTGFIDAGAMCPFCPKAVTDKGKIRSTGL